MRKFTILRNTNAFTTDPFGPTTFTFDNKRESFDEPSLTVESLEPGELASMARDPGVSAIAPLMPTKLTLPLEAADEASWGVDAVGANDCPYDGSGVAVAVLDTGIDDAHPAFAGMDIVERDFSGSGNGDAQGHGTHCAGTIFGRDVNGTRIGVARGVSKALIGKVLGDDGRGTSDAFFLGMQWALNAGAKVISMSLGFDFTQAVKDEVEAGLAVEAATSRALVAYRGNLRMCDAIMALARARTAFDGGAVVVAAAGNESNRPSYEIAAQLPAAAEGIVSVGALGQSAGKYTVAPFSNALCTLAAPGVSIVSARSGGGLRTLNGTSMAAPHVAGLAALWWQAVRDTSGPSRASVVRSNLIAHAQRDQFAPGADTTDRGAGLAKAPRG